MSGIIYMYTSPSGKCYIGQTVDEDRRRKEHMKHNQITTFHNAVKKYGYENMIYSILHKDIETKCALNILEHMEIKIRNTLCPNGYNMMTGGGAAGIPCEETRIKQSRSRRGKKHTEETIKRMQQAQKGRIITKEARIKMALYRSGSKQSQETKDKISLACKGHFVSENSRMKTSERNRKKIKCVETGVIYESFTNAAIEYKMKNLSSISACINNPRRTAYGYHWEYVL